MTNPEFEVNEEDFQEIMEFHFLSDEELTILLGRPDPVIHCSYLLVKEFFVCFCVGFQVQDFNQGPLWG